MDLLMSGKRSARRLGLSVFARVNPGDVTIRHHYTSEPIRLHSFRHKGYWFHGRRRERAEMAAFAHFVRPGDCVLEIGGHIGYVALYFAKLVGPTGSVHVFEPGFNNLPYLRANVGPKPGVRVVAKAAGKDGGVLPLFVEDLTGQNNSLVPEFEGLAVNQRNAVKAHVVEYPVEVVTIDSYVEETGVLPHFIKVDVEGYEWEVLCGAQESIRRAQPVMMVEVQSHRPEIAELLLDSGYRMFSAVGRPLTEIPPGTTNVFCVPESRRCPDAWSGR
jgi:FkbM family methyltransferase